MQAAQKPRNVENLLCQGSAVTCKLVFILLEGYFFLLFLFISYVCVSVCVQVCECVLSYKGSGGVTLHMWRLENSLQELVLSPYHV